MTASWTFVALTFFILCGIGNGDYQVPKIEFEPNGSGFSIFIPDEPNVVKSVNYNLKVNNKCPTIRNHLFAPKDGKWTLKESVQKGDNVTVSLFFEIADETLKSYTSKYITDAGVVVDIAGAQLPGLCQPQAEACKPTETTFMGKTANCSGVLLFEESFDGDLSLWKHEIRSVINSQNPELVAFDNQAENCFLKDGRLNIVAKWNGKKPFEATQRCTSLLDTSIRKEECGHDTANVKHSVPIAISAKIHTREMVFCKFCRMEARVKFPKGNFLYPYIQLYPKSMNTERAYVNQMRIAARGNMNLQSKCNGEQMDGRIVFGEILHWDPSFKYNTRIERKYRAEKHFGDEFHDYVINWRRNRVHFEVDGSSIGIINTSDVPTFNDEEFYIVLGLTVGGQYNFPDIIDAHAAVFSETSQKHINRFRRDAAIRQSWEQPTLEVDYVRLFATEK